MTGYLLLTEARRVVAQSDLETCALGCALEHLGIPDDVPMRFLAHPSSVAGLMVREHGLRLSKMCFQKSEA